MNSDKKLQNKKNAPEQNSKVKLLLLAQERLFNRSSGIRF